MKIRIDSTHMVFKSVAPIEAIREVLLSGFVQGPYRESLGYAFDLTLSFDEETGVFKFNRTLGGSIKSAAFVECKLGGIMVYLGEIVE